MGQVESDNIHPDALEYYCSPGFRALAPINGLSTLATYMQPLTNYPIISVGSGSGYVEKWLEDNHNYQLILVDPIDPDSKECFAPVPKHLSKKSSYDDSSDLVADKPDIISNCNLFLNWPEPNDDSYDYDAIMLLKPHTIIICCEVSGSSGSKKLLAWLRYCGLDSSDIDSYISSEKINGPEYHIDKCISLDSKCLMGWPTRFMLIQLSRK